MDEQEKKPGSGLFLNLKPGEQLEIKGTEYIVRNNGVITAQLHIFTQAFKAQIKDKVRGRFVEQEAPSKARSTWKYVKKLGEE